MQMMEEAFSERCDLRSSAWSAEEVVGWLRGACQMKFKTLEYVSGGRGGSLEPEISLEPCDLGCESRVFPRFVIEKEAVAARLERHPLDLRPEVPGSACRGA